MKMYTDRKTKSGTDRQMETDKQTGKVRDWWTVRETDRENE